ncbi:MAG: hypothetical protein V3W45_02460, partial [Sedimentisphaerales bacterium]
WSAGHAVHRNRFGQYQEQAEMDSIQEGIKKERNIDTEFERVCIQRRKDALRVNFDRKLKVEFHGTKVTSDASEQGYTMLYGNLQGG